MPQAFREHVRHNIVGYIAIFCFVIGGTAVALPGKNKVDTGDIKRNAVRTSDIARNAVRAVKIAPRSVDSLRVIDDSLGGDDIVESTLDIRTSPSSIGPTELVDQQRTLAYSAGALVAPGSPESPELTTSFSFSALAYNPTEEGFATLNVQVPRDRVPGSGMVVRLLWSAGGVASGAVFWDLQAESIAVGDELGKPTSTEVVTATTPNELTQTAFPIPGNTLQNGDTLGLSIARGASNDDDTLPIAARLHQVEIDYTATG
jgi:hypothetical protein